MSFDICILCMYLFIYVFMYLCIYVFIYLFTYIFTRPPKRGVSETTGPNPMKDAMCPLGFPLPPTTGIGSPQKNMYAQVISPTACGSFF